MAKGEEESLEGCCLKMEGLAEVTGRVGGWVSRWPIALGGVKEAYIVALTAAATVETSS